MIRYQRKSKGSWKDPIGFNLQQTNDQSLYDEFNKDRKFSPQTNADKRECQVGLFEAKNTVTSFILNKGWIHLFIYL